jgi:hypothetical protein
MNKVHAITGCTVLSVLCGCSTPYKPEGFMGGYSDTQLDKNVFRVSVRGNGYTSHDRVSELALLRSAVITLERGFTYFVVVDERSFTKSVAFTTPVQSNTTFNATASGNQIYGTSNTTTFGGHTFLVSKPRATNTIVMFIGKPEGIQSYDAKFMCHSLGKKYNVTCGGATSALVASAPIKKANSKLVFETPLGWQAAEMSQQMLQNGSVFFAKNKNIDAAILISEASKDGITDYISYATSRRAAQASNLQESSWSDVTETSINGRRSWRFWVKGKVNSGMQVQYLGTVIEGASTVAFVNAWTSEANFDAQRETLESLAESISGI